MKKIFLILLIIALTLGAVSCKSGAPVPQTEVEAEPAAQPFVPESAGFANKSLIFELGDKTYTNYHTNYGYSYYFPTDTRLVPTGDTVTVREWVTCGTGLPENYVPPSFESEVYTIENDIYDGRFVFIKDPDENTYYPFATGKDAEIGENDTVLQYINKLHGEGAFENITDVRLVNQEWLGEWYQLTDDVAKKVLAAVSEQKAERGWPLCECTYYWDTEEHLYIRLVMPKTRLELQMTLCPKEYKLHGIEIGEQLYTEIRACLAHEYLQKP